MRKRQRNKILKLIANRINNDDYRRLPTAHFRFISRMIGNFMMKKYMSEINQVSYNRFSCSSSIDFRLEHKKHYDLSVRELQDQTGIDMEKYQCYFDLNHKNSIVILPSHEIAKEIIVQQDEGHGEKVRASFNRYFIRRHVEDVS